MASPRCCTCRRLRYYWVLWASCQSRHHDWHGECSRTYKEVLHGRYHFRRLLRRQYHWASIDYIADKVQGTTQSFGWVLLYGKL